MNYAKKLLACHDARSNCTAALKRIEHLETACDLEEFDLTQMPGDTGCKCNIEFYESMLEREWDRFVFYQAEFEKKKVEVLQLLAPLPVAWKRLMEMRYVEAQKWDSIAEKLPYGKTKCLEMHKKALNALREV